MSAQWIPKGFHTITPNIIVDDVEQEMAFLKNALGATESYRLTMSHGKITIASTGVLELKASTVIVNGRVVQQSNDPIK